MVERGIRRYGFAGLVSGALACALYLAGSVAVPDPVPDFALQAEEIYRLEIGAAFFIAFYLAAMAFVLALSNNSLGYFLWTLKWLKTLGARGIGLASRIPRSFPSTGLTTTRKPSKQ